MVSGTFRGTCSGTSTHTLKLAQGVNAAAPGFQPQRESTSAGCRRGSPRLHGVGFSRSGGGVGVGPRDDGAGRASPYTALASGSYPALTGEIHVHGIHNVHAGWDHNRESKQLEVAFSWQPHGAGNLDGLVRLCVHSPATPFLPAEVILAGPPAHPLAVLLHQGSILIGPQEDSQTGNVGLRAHGDGDCYSFPVADRFRESVPRRCPGGTLGFR